MKKIIILFGVFILNSLNAQIEKGTVLTGGSITYNGFTNNDEFSIYSNGVVIDEYKSTFIVIRPQIGFFTSETTLLGIGLTYEHSGIEQRSSFEGLTNEPVIEKKNTYLINPYLTKFFELKEKFYFTTRVNVLAGIGKGKYGENNEIETNLFDIRINLSPGLTYFISEKWTLTASMGQLFYNRHQETIKTDLGLAEDPKNIQNNYGIDFNFNTFSVGFQYFLNNKNKS